MENIDKTSHDILKMSNITKIYSNGFIANNDVNFSIREGEIHGLVGENGAGKTTLMKVLFGQEIAESGEIFLDGKLVKFDNPIQALKSGIGMVHQHFMLVESLSVAENLVLGNEPVKGISFDYNTAIKKSLEVSEMYDLKIDPKAKVSDLSVGYKQRVEILKMLLNGAKILLLDEPTAVLTPQETTELFIQLKELSKQGFSIVFISHKLEEVKQLCDRITVLRRGESVVTADVDDLSIKDISSLMIGKELTDDIDKGDRDFKDVVLKVRDLNFINDLGVRSFNNINFDIKAGEILGVAGVEGNGQSELSSVLSGLDQIQSGDVSVLGNSIKELSINELRSLGVSIIHEDRMIYGASVNQSIADNLISDRYYTEEYTKKGLLNLNRIKETAVEYIDKFKIKTDSYDSLVRILSGGNIQKVVAAREFTSNPKLLIASQPTRGIDVGAARLIHETMIDLRDNDSVATLLFSADLNELLQISDNIIVMFEGEIVAYFSDTSKINEEILGEYMLGIKRQTEAQLKEAIYDEQA